MATSWQEVFDVGDRDVGRPGAPEADDAPDERRGGSSAACARASRRAAKRSAPSSSASLGDHLDEETWERLEETLILADVGPRTTAEVVGSSRWRSRRATSRARRRRAIASIELLAEVADTGEPRIDVSKKPAVLMIVGVNGSGKTTTIGKIAWHLEKELGLSVILAAGDTYRAAAVEQLETWAERSGAQIVKAASQTPTPAPSPSTRSAPPRRAASTS